ncbi:Molybdopterin molybdenumtransferase OS=Streptomyces tendae OX=1932 GN=F3L20_29150 PE=3 SV=1 [Streptomyces tendae]
MDGYAVRVADIAGASEEYPASLEVVGDVAAGAAEPRTSAPARPRAS